MAKTSFKLAETNSFKSLKRNVCAMFTMGAIIFDIETCPINKEGYLAVEDEKERLKFLNPIDSKIIAVGLKFGEEIRLLQNDNEKELLEETWAEIKTFRKGNSAIKLVGFNVKLFDLPFLVTRSFALNVTIAPFVLKDVIDLREKVSVFRWGKTRGTLKDFGTFMGLGLSDMDGSQVAETYWAGEKSKLKEYLKKDLEITEKMYQRIVDTNIIGIERW